jgi:hypothetical protein
MHLFTLEIKYYYVLNIFKWYKKLILIYDTTNNENLKNNTGKFSLIFILHIHKNKKKSKKKHNERNNTELKGNNTIYNLNNGGI